jgi:SMC interacting uncharacterized protein involved in chromosome segregation
MTTRRPDGRPGHRKPAHKATLAEQEQMLDYMAGLLVKERTYGEIKRAMKRKFNLEYRQIAVYKARAQKWLKMRASITKDDALVKGLNVLLEVLRTGTNKEKLRVEKRLGEIFGYNSPVRVNTQVSGTNGGPIKISNEVQEMSTEELLRVADLGRLQQAAGE